MMVALHPFMPFITEEIWHQLRTRTEGDDCCIQTYPKATTADQALIAQVETAKDVIGKIREIRNQNQIKPRDPLVVIGQSGPVSEVLFARSGLREMVIKLGNLSELTFSESEPENAKSFISGTEKYYVVLSQEIDVKAEINKITTELGYQQGFAQSVQVKLSNERFVSGAPAQVIDNERKKLADAQTRIAILEESLAKLKS